MSSNRDFKTICKKYFTPMENDIFKCKCGKILKQKKGTGWSNLMVHIRTQHETTPSGPQNTLDFMQCKKSQTIHDWIEWICMELRPFSFVESEYVKKNVKLEAISKNTLQKYMHLLTKKVEQEIIKAMPEKIALIVDGWTSGSTHYLGVMASFCDECALNVNENLACKKLRRTSDIECEFPQTDDFAGNVLAKKKKDTKQMKYIPCSFILPTSNHLERFFSAAGFASNDYRKSTLPMNLEEQLFLRFNKKHWDLNLVNQIVSASE